MATNSRTMPLSRDQVWQTLSDGSTYSHWVVGTSMIRDVEPSWPAPGSQLHYSVGRGPWRHDGHTEVHASEPGRVLTLEAHAWPVGSMHIELRLEEVADGTRVTMEERPRRGLGATLHNPATDLVIKARNVESLRRLENLARQRPRTAAGTGPAESAQT